MIKSHLILPEKNINVEGGNVLHFMKNSSVGYTKFGEVYFSKLKSEVFKGWKKHTRMTANFVVPLGAVIFFIQDKFDGETFTKVKLDEDINYKRLIVMPNYWYGFCSASKQTSLIGCVLNEEHDESESIKCKENDFFCDWRKI